MFLRSTGQKAAGYAASKDNPRQRKRAWIMKSLLNNLRAAVVALSSISLVTPSTIWAKSPAAGHVTSQARISSSMASTPTTIHSSNGLSSDKSPNLSVNSSISGNSQPGGGGHIHNPSVGSSTVGSGTSKVSGLTSPWDSKVIPTGGGSVKGVAGVRSSHVMDLGSDIKDLAKGTGEVIDDIFGVDHGPFKGTDPTPAPSTYTPSPGSGSLASIANTNAKYYDRNAYTKTTNKNLVSKEIEKKYNDSHPSAQKNRVTGGGSSSNGQSGGSSGGGGSNGGNTNGSGNTTGGSATGGSTSNKPHKCFPMPFPFPFPTGCDDGGGYAGGDVSPAIYSSDDPAPAPVMTASAVAPAADASVDLVLEDVKLAAPATLVAGPAYTVTFRNQGTAPAGKFEVAILAGLDGKLIDDAPRAVVEVASLAAGEAKQVTLRLPQKALKLARADGTSTAFTHLFVAVDLMNTVAETDKTNNTAIVERAALEGSIASN